MILGILKTNDIYSYHIIIIIDIGGDGGNSGDGVLYVCVLVHVCYFPSIIFFCVRFSILCVFRVAINIFRLKLSFYHLL